MAACIRILSEYLPQSEVVFFRNFLALLLLLPLMYRQKISLKSSVWGLHLFRAFIGLSAMYLYFYALFHLPLADALLLNYTSPLFIAMFATIWLGETWTRSRKIAAITGLIGVALLFHPSSEIASTAGLIGLASGALAGLALTTVKKLSNTEPAIRIVIWFAMLASLISFIPMLFEFRWPDAEQWGWLVAMGIFGNIGHLALTRAYKQAPASQVSPLGYSGLIFAGLLGYLLWSEIPDLLGLLGTTAIVIAGILVARERSEPMPEPPGAVPAIDEQERI
ncbi:eamA-like transporter family protein [Mariprofundus micogutta]|uniref:EamA-like transporter family protein n=2 Tax=Mariprofundus micogutta TaxID=1921010 RepID=A0A1L8CQ63_9PROT|nr:eamA-like transporter family protein [Mariprofundus micogutta]